MVKSNAKSFVERLQGSKSDIIRERASRLAKALFRSQKKIIEDLDEEIDKIKDKMDTSLDLHPKNEYSLVVGEDFRVDQWANQYQAWKVELRIKTAELEEAQNTMKELFPNGFNENDNAKED